MRLLAAFIEICRALDALVFRHVILDEAAADYVLCGIWFFSRHPVEILADSFS